VYKRQALARAGNRLASVFIRESGF
jgi:hypothetical protein